MNEVKDFQIKAAEKLKNKFSLRDEEVDISWPAFAGEGRRIYQPLIDIAVGPFAIGTRRCVEEHDAMVLNSRKLITNGLSYLGTTGKQLLVNTIG